MKKISPPRFSEILISSLLSIVFLPFSPLLLHHTNYYYYYPPLLIYSETAIQILEALSRATFCYLLYLDGLLAYPNQSTPDPSIRI